MEIEENKFTYTTNIQHTHEGSIGNLCNLQIKEMMQKLNGDFKFQEYHQAIQRLLND